VPSAVETFLRSATSANSTPRRLAAIAHGYLVKPRIRMFAGAIAAVLLLAAPGLMSEYRLHIATLVLIFVLLALGQNLVTGNSGQVSMGHAAIYGLGAYVAGVLGGTHGWSGLAVFATAVVSTSVVGLLVALPAIRLSGDYLFIVTIGLNLVFLDVVNQWVSVTGGSTGIVAIPLLDFGPLHIRSFKDFYYLTLVAACIGIGVVVALLRSRFGSVVEASRDDPLAAAAIGIAITPVRVSVYAISAGLAGLAGALLAYFIGFVGPQDFVVQQSLVIFEMAIIGGLGSVAGSVAGAIILIGGPELLRPLQPYAVGLGGLLVILVMVLRPQGLFGKTKVPNLIRK
jgi:branched-chain amino acid transport system permease protein